MFAKMLSKIKTFWTSVHMFVYIVAASAGISSFIVGVLFVSTPWLTTGFLLLIASIMGLHGKTLLPEEPLVEHAE